MASQEQYLERFRFRYFTHDGFNRSCVVKPEVPRRYKHKECRETLKFELVESLAKRKGYKARRSLIRRLLLKREDTRITEILELIIKQAEEEAEFSILWEMKVFKGQWSK